MKKLFLTGLVALLVGSASAQIVTSRSRLVTKVRSPRKTVWVVHAGVGMDNMSTTDHYNGMSVDVKGRFGYNTGIQFNRPVTEHSYWGMDLSYGSTGCEFESNGFENYFDYWNGGLASHEVSYSGTVREHYLQFSPVIYGWKIPIGSQCAVDLHVEAYAAFKFSGLNETEVSFYDGYSNGYIEENDINGHMDFGVKVGAGFWFKKIKWDFMYRQGFVDSRISKDRYGFQRAMVYSLLFSVGYAF